MVTWALVWNSLGSLVVGVVVVCERDKVCTEDEMETLDMYMMLWRGWGGEVDYGRSAIRLTSL